MSKFSESQMLLWFSVAVLVASLINFHCTAAALPEWVFGPDTLNYSSVCDKGLQEEWHSYFKTLQATSNVYRDYSL